MRVLYNLFRNSPHAFRSNPARFIQLFVFSLWLTWLSVDSFAQAQEWPPRRFEWMNARRFSEHVGYKESVIGNFSSTTCADILARSETDRKVYISTAVGSILAVDGLPDDFSLKDAVVFDADVDGRSDLLAYSGSANIWYLAKALGESSFATERVSLLDEAPSMPVYAKPFIFHEADTSYILAVFPRRIASFIYQGGSVRKFWEEATDPNLRPVGILSGIPSNPKTVHFGSILYQVHLNKHALVRINAQSDSPFITWAQFPAPSDASKAIFGKFNNDPTTDALAPAWGLGSWWIAEGYDTGLEYPVLGLESLKPDSEAIAVGDIDCDGRDDLLLRDIEQGTIRFAASRLESQYTTVKTLPLAARSQTAGMPGPFVCVGFLPNAVLSASRWGRPVRCPDEYAIFSTSYSVFAGTDSCCRLPNADILLQDQTVVTASVCPEGYVVTGIDFQQRKFHCTAVNTSRYALIDQHAAYSWGAGRRRPGGSGSIQTSEMPLAMRNSVGRISFQHWNSEGCIGAPWGTLFSGSIEDQNACSSQQYRRLVYKGRAGDPSFGTPVKIFPECNGEVDSFDPNAGCILRADESHSGQTGHHRENRTSRSIQ